MNSQQQAELEGEALDQLGVAQQSGRWMAVFWRVVDGRLYIQETTCEFPIGDFDESVAMLRRALDAKLGILPPEPLPLAPHLTFKQEITTPREERSSLEGLMVGLPNSDYSGLMTAECALPPASDFQMPIVD